MIVPVGLDPPASVAESVSDPPTGIPADAVVDSVGEAAITADVTDAVLFAVFGSGVDDETVAESVRDVVIAVGLTVIVTVFEPPLGSLLIEPPIPTRQVMVVVPEQVCPVAESVVETRLTPAGRTSLRLTAVATFAPWFVTLIV